MMKLLGVILKGWGMLCLFLEDQLYAEKKQLLKYNYTDRQI